MSPPSDAVLRAGSLILVTGANGFLASRIVDELLASGYRVRGTVRDPVKQSWLQDHFDKTYGSDQFELVGVRDLKEEGSLNQVVKGCAGLVHVASNVSFSPDPNVVVTETVTLTLNALKAAASESSLSRFVLTSSSIAAAQSRYNEPYDLTPEMWNTKAVEAAWAPPPYEMDRAVAVYGASKTQAEQAMWKFVEEQKPHFVVNAVLPDFICGLPVKLEKQGYGPSCGMLYALWNHDDRFKLLYPQFLVDAGDAALLHIVALLKPDVRNERIFAYAHNRTWTDTIPRLRRMYPNHTFPDPPENEGVDMANVIGQKRAEELLKWMGQPGWRPMEESLKEVCDTMQ
ncbi:hypothetical protein BAUCODRAFT_27580 [Baudoinia panamericana UAMH 10762]|uniref:NAD-dependent epimerase/dehydratase domain-containing protein n=1 Tax=Baudoinia panamericana (strain UAMH 10762) TaxID=717646 RepID=M2M7G2_BAUPA|nr:uncharacterized protein BAUCODRAFT_27580 [Baudoinia panamericana UAMH 10762]EMC92261.1 hypothetical protein BAUCODRAFT_27580 [Baudoinia panamericana UAMH 10762]